MWRFNGCSRGRKPANWLLQPRHFIHFNWCKQFQKNIESDFKNVNWIVITADAWTSYNKWVLATIIFSPALIFWHETSLKSEHRVPGPGQKNQSVRKNNATEGDGGQAEWWGWGGMMHGMRKSGVARRSPLKVIRRRHDGLLRKGQLEQWPVTSLAYVLCSQCYFCYVCKVLSLIVFQF